MCKLKRRNLTAAEWNINITETTFTTIYTFNSKYRKEKKGTFLLYGPYTNLIMLSPSSLPLLHKSAIITKALAPIVVLGIFLMIGWRRSPLEVSVCLLLLLFFISIRGKRGKKGEWIEASAIFYERRTAIGGGDVSNWQFCSLTIETKKGIVENSLDWLTIKEPISSV